MPQTVTLTGAEAEAAQKQLQDFFDQSCVDAIDSDVRLGWKSLGKQTYYPATLQLARPLFSRLSLVDPLGRPLILLTTTATTFTFADNTLGKGYTGKLDARFLQQYVPEGLLLKDLFFWLSGRVHHDGFSLQSVGRAEQGEILWYSFTAADGFIHLLGLDHDRLASHLVVDQDNELLLSVSYSDYTKTPKDCEWPGKIHLSSDRFFPELQIEFIKNYGFAPPDKHIFSFLFPAHFSVQTVE